MGFVRSMSRTQNIAICSQPLKVMGGSSWEGPLSEAFWADQGIDKIDEQTDRNDRAQYVVEDHGAALTGDRRRTRRARKPRGRERQSRGRRCRAWDFSWLGHHGVQD